MSQSVALRRPRPLVLADLIPGALARDVALVVAGAGFVGLLAQIARGLPDPDPRCAAMPAGLEHVIRSALVADPANQIVIEPLTILDLTADGDANRHVLRQLAHPASDRSLRGALLSAVEKIPRRHFRPAELRSLAATAAELATAAAPLTANGKVANVLDGVQLARHDVVVIADDDVRWDRPTLVTALDRLGEAVVLRPQNHFEQLVWHAVIDSARIAPVVILTAFSQRDLVERARDAGAMAYLVKPFHKRDLLPAVEMALTMLSNHITADAMRDLNRRVDVEHQPVVAVVRNFLATQK